MQQRSRRKDKHLRRHRTAKTTGNVSVTHAGAPLQAAIPAHLDPAIDLDTVMMAHTSPFQSRLDLERRLATRKRIFTVVILAATVVLLTLVGIMVWLYMTRWRKSTSNSNDTSSSGDSSSGPSDGGGGSDSGTSSADNNASRLALILGVGIIGALLIIGMTLFLYWRMKRAARSTADGIYNYSATKLASMRDTVAGAFESLGWKSPSDEAQEVEDGSNRSTAAGNKAANINVETQEDAMFVGFSELFSNLAVLSSNVVSSAKASFNQITGRGPSIEMVKDLEKQAKELPEEDKAKKKKGLVMPWKRRGNKKDKEVSSAVRSGVRHVYGSRFFSPGPYRSSGVHIEGSLSLPAYLVQESERRAREERLMREAVANAEELARRALAAGELIQNRSKPYDFSQQPKRFGNRVANAKTLRTYLTNLKQEGADIDDPSAIDEDTKKNVQERSQAAIDEVVALVKERDRLNSQLASGNHSDGETFTMERNVKSLDKAINQSLSVLRATKLTNDALNMYLSTEAVELAESYQALETDKSGAVTSMVGSSFEFVLGKIQSAVKSGKKMAKSARNNLGEQMDNLNKATMKLASTTKDALGSGTPLDSAPSDGYRDGYTAGEGAGGLLDEEELARGRRRARSIDSQVLAVGRKATDLSFQHELQVRGNRNMQSPGFGRPPVYRVEAFQSPTPNYQGVGLAGTFPYGFAVVSSPFDIALGHHLVTQARIPETVERTLYHAAAASDFERLKTFGQIRRALNRDIRKAVEELRAGKINIKQFTFRCNLLKARALDDAMREIDSIESASARERANGLYDEHFKDVDSFVGRVITYETDSLQEEAGIKEAIDEAKSQKASDEAEIEDEELDNLVDAFTPLEEAKELLGRGEKRRRSSSEMSTPPHINRLKTEELLEDDSAKIEQVQTTATANIRKRRDESINAALKRKRDNDADAAEEDLPFRRGTGTKLAKKTDKLDKFVNQIEDRRIPYKRIPRQRAFQRLTRDKDYIHISTRRTLKSVVKASRHALDDLEHDLDTVAENAERETEELASERSSNTTSVTKQVEPEQA